VELARPLALLGLLLLAPLWWAARRAARPEVVAWPSLLLWRRVLAQHPELAVAERPARPPLGAFSLGAAVIASLCLAASGLSLPGEGQPRLGVVVDASPSTGARAAAGGTRGDRIRGAARELAAVVPAELREQVVVTAADHGGTSGGAALADAALAMRARGADVIAVVSDHVEAAPWEGAPTLVAVVPAGPAAPNAGIVGAGARVRRAGGATTAGAEVSLLLRVGAAGSGAAQLEVEVTADPEGAGPPLARRRVPSATFDKPAVVRLDVAPPPAAKLVARVRAVDGSGALLPDGFPQDDSVWLVPPAVGVRLRAPDGAEALPAVLRAGLEAAGGAWVSEVDGPAEVLVLQGDASTALRVRGARLVVTPDAGAGAPAGEIVRRPGPPLTHTDVAGLRFAVAPAPAPEGVRPLLVDAVGRTVAGYGEDAEGRLAWIGLPLRSAEVADPWQRHPSFPVLVAELLEALAGREQQSALYRVAGLSGARESRQAGEGGPVGGIAAVRGALADARARLGARGRIDLTPWLLVAAMLLAVTTWLVTRRRPLLS
jgi:hypothetical protein